MKTAAIALLSCWLLSAVAAIAQIHPGDNVVPKGEYNAVTVEGRGDSKEAALRDALRNAVEQGAGQFIHSQTENKNYQAILDKVLSKSAGFVKSYEPNPPKYSSPDADGIITTKITAMVSVKAVETEWGAIQILLEQKGKPRVMVAIGERIDGQRQDDSTVASEIENLLSKNDFPLIDKAQFTEIQKRDITSASFEDDLGKVIALGKQFGAEIVITGSSQADYGSMEDFYGVPAYMYGTTVKVKVVRTDNAAILFSDNLSTRKGERTKTGGAHKALQEAGVQMARKVQDGIVAKWGREVAESQSINLEITNITFSQRTKFVEAIKALARPNGKPIVAGVQNRALANKVASFTVDVRGSAEEFATAMDRMKDWKMEITDVTANSVKCRFVEQ